MDNQSKQEVEQTSNLPETLGEDVPEVIEEKGVVTGFRLKPSEKELVDKLIQYAYMAQKIKEPTFQAYMMFALNCAYARLQQDFQSGSKN